MSYSSTQFPDEYDFLAVCCAAIDRQDYKAALFSLKKGLSRNLEEGTQINGIEFMRCLQVVVETLDSSLRKAYGYEWDRNIKIPKAREDWRKSRCSFCGKKEEEVEKVIVGSVGSICNECVNICNEILRDIEKASSDDGTA